MWQRTTKKDMFRKIIMITLHCNTTKGGSAMLAEKIEKLEYENARLREILRLRTDSIPKPRECQNCKYYIRHYGRSNEGVYFKLHIGHCACGVSIGKRKGKGNPTPEDTCTCFEEGIWN